MSSDTSDDADHPADVVFLSPAEVMASISDDHTSSSSSSHVSSAYNPAPAFVPLADHQVVSEGSVAVSEPPDDETDSSDQSSLHSVAESHPLSSPIPHSAHSDQSPSVQSHTPVSSHDSSPVAQALPASSSRAAYLGRSAPSPPILRSPLEQQRNGHQKRPSPSSARKLSQGSSDENACSICLEAWTSSGEHHLCCLPCGHLFGYHCIKTWLQANRRGRCPTCKVSARVRDLRYIFGVPARLAVVDTTELEHARKKLREEQESHERTRVRLRELRKVTDKALKEVADLRRRTTNPSPSFGGVSRGSRGGSRVDGPSLLANCPTNGGTVAVSFDGNGGVLYSEKIAPAGTPGWAQRIARLDIGRCTVVETSRVASQRRVNAVAVCTWGSASSRCVAVAGGERRLRILAPGLIVAADVECDGLPLSATWLEGKPNWVVCGMVDGCMLTFDVRHMGLGPLYKSEIARGGARAVHSVRECVVDGETVVVTGTTGGVYGLSYDGYLNTPTVTEIVGARAADSSVCAVSVSDGLVAVSSRRHGDLSKRGRIAVYEGLKRNEDGTLKVGDSVGGPLEGHMQALPFGEVGVLGGDDEGKPIVVAGDADAKGGVRMWSAEIADGCRRWETYEVGSDGGGEGEMVRATTAMKLPRRARLGSVPTGMKGLFACVSNTNIRLFGAGWYPWVPVAQR